MACQDKRRGKRQEILEHEKEISPGAQSESGCLAADLKRPDAFFTPDVKPDHIPRLRFGLAMR